jgi:hypothetical protein
LDITKERIDRHYKVKQMKNPSPYISAMSSLSKLRLRIFSSSTLTQNRRRRRHCSQDV